MNPWVALLAVLAACWHAWLTLALRVPSLADAFPLLLAAAALLLPWWLSRTPLRAVPVLPLTLLLMMYAAMLSLPPLLRVVPAALAVAWCLHAALNAGTPPASFFGLVALALPVVPSLEFYGAYPIRLFALQASAALLRMNGIAVDTEGLALRFGGQLVEFDAPCSGVRMLWTCWFLASALAYLQRLSFGRYAGALVLATLLAVASNIVRATSLFYLESGIFAWAQRPWLHEAVGIAAFCLTALLLCVAMSRRAWRPKAA